MATKSVFTFEFKKSESRDKIEKRIKEYLYERNFEYNCEKKCYIKIPGKINKAAYAATAVAGAALGKVVLVSSFPFGFEYEINENKLIIKAYLLSSDFKRSKFIHSRLNNSQVANNYYDDLKSELFSDLEEDLILTNTEKEKLEDKTENKIRIVAFIIFILCGLILFLCL